MKLKKITAAICAAAVAVSTVAVTPLFSSAAASDPVDTTLYDYSTTTPIGPNYDSSTGTFTQKFTAGSGNDLGSTAATSNITVTVTGTLASGVTKGTVTASVAGTDDDSTYSVTKTDGTNTLKINSSSQVVTTPSTATAPTGDAIATFDTSSSNDLTVIAEGYASVTKISVQLDSASAVEKEYSASGGAFSFAQETESIVIAASDLGITTVDEIENSTLTITVNASAASGNTIDVKTNAATPSTVVALTDDSTPSISASIAAATDIEDISLAGLTNKVAQEILDNGLVVTASTDVTISKIVLSTVKTLPTSGATTGSETNDIEALSTGTAFGDEGTVALTSSDTVDNTSIASKTVTFDVIVGSYSDPLDIYGYQDAPTVETAYDKEETFTNTVSTIEAVPSIVEFDGNVNTQAVAAYADVTETGKYGIKLTFTVTLANASVPTEVDYNYINNLGIKYQLYVGNKAKVSASAQLVATSSGTDTSTQKLYSEEDFSINDDNGTSFSWTLALPTDAEGTALTGAAFDNGTYVLNLTSEDFAGKSADLKITTATVNSVDVSSTLITDKTVTFDENGKAAINFADGVVTYTNASSGDTLVLEFTLTEQADDDDDDDDDGEDETGNEPETYIAKLAANESYDLGKYLTETKGVTDLSKVASVTVVTTGDGNGTIAWKAPAWTQKDFSSTGTWTTDVTLDSSEYYLYAYSWVDYVYITSIDCTLKKTDDTTTVVPTAAPKVDNGSSSYVAPTTSLTPVTAKATTEDGVVSAINRAKKNVTIVATGEAGEAGLTPEIAAALYGKKNVTVKFRSSDRTLIVKSADVTSGDATAQITPVVKLTKTGAKIKLTGELTGVDKVKVGIKLPTLNGEKVKVTLGGKTIATKYVTANYLYIDVTPDMVGKVLTVTTVK
jgi:hypothetical protein